MPFDCPARRFILITYAGPRLGVHSASAAPRSRTVRQLEISEEYSPFRRINAPAGLVQPVVLLQDLGLIGGGVAASAGSLAYVWIRDLGILSLAPTKGCLLPRPSAQTFVPVCYLCLFWQGGDRAGVAHPDRAPGCVDAQPDRFPPLADSVLLALLRPGTQPHRGRPHLKRSLGNLASATLDQLAALIRTRLKRVQYRSSLFDAFITHTGLTRHKKPVMNPDLSTSVP